MPEQDFDFFMGSWRVAHRRLRKRLADCTEWDEFGGTSVARKLLGGAGNVDDNWIELPGGAYRAVTLRAYNSAADRWSIWWLDGRFPDRVDTPMVGQFANAVGTFYADDTFEAKPIRVRFFWTRPGYDTPRWEQAFSADAGKTWETNWIMNFTRE